MMRRSKPTKMPAGKRRKCLRGWLLVCAALATLSWCNSVWATDERARPLHLAFRGGLTTEEWTPIGSWVDAGVLWEQPLTAATYLTFEADVAAIRESTEWTLTYYDYLNEETSHNRRFLIGVPLRAGVGLGRQAFGFEVGAVAGAGYENLKSDICSNDSGVRPMLGGYLGPVIRIGSINPIRIAAQLQMISPIMRRCSNTGGSNMNSYGPIWFADSPPNPSLVAQVAIPVW